MCTDERAVKKLSTLIKSIRLPWISQSTLDLHVDGSMGQVRVPRRESVHIPKSRRFILTLLVQDFPRGFPRLACFLDSDDAFMVYRRFGLVFSRLLLNKQDEIREMEATLLAMDRTDEACGNDEYLMSRTGDVNRDGQSIPRLWPETRPQLLERLEKKALEYGGSTTALIN